MKHRFTRRRFVQAALAGGAVLSGIPAAGKIFARTATPTLTFLGVRPGLVPTTGDVPEIDRTEIDGAPGLPGGVGVSLPLEVRSLDVVSGQLRTISTFQGLADGTPILRSGDMLTGATALADGTLVLTITAAESAASTRLVLLGATPIALPILGLKKDEELESVIAAGDGTLTGLVMKKNGTPPTRLAVIELATGVLSSSVLVMPEARRFRTLARCPDGTLYTIAIDRAGDTTLVRLDPGQRRPVAVAKMTSDGTAWNNGMASLVCSGAGGLYALGAPRYVTPNAIYSVDIVSGVMAQLYNFDVARMAPAHT